MINSTQYCLISHLSEAQDTVLEGKADEVANNLTPLRESKGIFADNGLSTDGTSEAM